MAIQIQLLLNRHIYKAMISITEGSKKLKKRKAFLNSLSTCESTVQVARDLLGMSGSFSYW